MSALTLSQPTAVGTGAWRYTYSGTAPFRRYVNGLLVVRPTDTSLGYSEDTFIIVEDTSDPVEPPVVEAYDATDTTSIPVQYTNASQLILQWRGYSADEFYTVQYWSGSTWTTPTNGRVPSHGLGYYQYYTITPMSGDVKWRVTANQVNGLTTIPVQFNITTVPNPDPPSIEGSYSAGTGLLTISLRA